MLLLAMFRNCTVNTRGSARRLINGGEGCRDVARLRRFRKGGHVVDDCHRIVAVDVCQLGWL